MSFFSLAQNKALQAAAAVGALAAAPVAFAQSTGADATFAAEIAKVTTSVTTYGGALVILAAVGVAFMVGIKYIKKIRGAA